MPSREEVLRMRRRIAQQDAELRRCKRLLVVHSIFFRWKVWYLSRQVEYLETEAEEERHAVALRLATVNEELLRLRRLGPAEPFPLD